jgi:alkanesulfonate monooxygenase SsuD/methylene tetrahydromethanopterin reductase-like flavin-dependent oxidoreductase (luciferase family)
MLTRLGLRLPSRIVSDERARRFDELVGLAAEGELNGFDSIWVSDRSDTDLDGSFEAYTLLGALAVRTHRARLGALTSSVTHRGPGILAKQVTALDILSSGRAILGVGPGTQEPGRDVTPQQQYDRFEEALEVLSSLLGKGTADVEDGEGVVSFSGRFYHLERAPNRPRPVQDGTLPVLISASDSETLKLVARHADACSFEGAPVSIRSQLSVLDRHMEEADRDPSTLTKTVSIPLGRFSGVAEGIEKFGSIEKLAEDVAGYRELGIDGVIVILPETWDERDDPELRSARDLVSAIGTAVGR